MRMRAVVRCLLSAALVLALGIAAAAPASANASSLGADVIASGMRYAGAPYEYGASASQTSTFDCSSFTYRAFLEQGITLPRTSQAQAQLGRTVKLQDAQAGDLLFYATGKAGVVNHVGIYMGGMRMLSATTSKGVRVVDISSSYWTERYLFAKRVLPSAHAVASGDGLWTIAYANGVTIDQLKRWNGLRTDMIYAGQRLFVSNPNLIEQARQRTYAYQVAGGDSLWRISQKTGVAIAAIMEANKLTSDALHVGQLLQIPVA